jgi:prepilin signal peptidase PulO-like enzyme (type II secretory pathway)
MPNIFIIFSFILGTIIGSFLNVVALRFNSGMTLKGRSKCFSCDKNLKWYELIPVFSFILQKGKCKQCKSKISWQYPIVELIAGFIFILIFYFYPPVDLESSINTLFYIIVTCLLLIISIYDIKHKIIPNEWVYSFSGLAFIKLFFLPNLSFMIPSILDLLSGPILALPFLLMSIFSGGKWMGYADSKLVLGIGWVLGLIPGISAIILAFWTGAVIGLFCMYFMYGKYKSKYEIPFGPYLILGMYIVLFTGIRVLEL